MDIDKIELLLKAIEYGSLTKAANEYLYTPSAVSHILDGIEGELGARFIKRTYKGIEVEAGCGEIVENLKQIVKLKNQTVKLAQNISGFEKTLTIATYASLSKQILPGILKSFNSKFPGIKVNIVVVESIKKAYDEGRADIMLGEEIEGEGISWKKLMTDPYVAVLPESVRFKDDTIKREDLYKYTFVMAKDSKISGYVEDGGFDRVLRVDSHDDSSVIHIVKEGLGVAILPMLSVADNEDIVCVDLEPKLCRSLGLIYKDSDFNSRKEIRDFIKNISL